jgi:hypothetical protein
VENAKKILAAIQVTTPKVQSMCNLLNNFTKSHIVSTLEIWAWYKKMGVTYEDHLQTKTGKVVVLTIIQHRVLVDEGLKILIPIVLGIFFIKTASK